MSRRRLLSYYLIMLVAVAGAALVASELLLRASGRVSTDTIHTVSSADYDRIPGMFEPGQDLVERPHPKLAYHMTINSLGFRGPEISFAKPAGVVRILCLGDSGTFGQFVNEGETFPEVLETLLRADNLPVEVINGGVMGTTIVDQLRFLERAMPLDPDIVLLTFSENDITDLASGEPQYVAFERNRELKSRPFFRLFYSPLRDTALFNFVLKLKANWAARPAGQAPGAHGESPDSREHLWAAYSMHLGEMQEYLSKHAVPLILDTFPTHHRIPPVSIGDDLRDQLERVEQLASEKGIPTIELLPTFLESGLGKQDLTLLPYDGHANARAYRLQAAALLPPLRQAVRDVLRAP